MEETPGDDLSATVNRLFDWTVRSNLDLCEKMLSSKSPVELAIYKLADYISHINIENDPVYQEIREKGLRPRHIRYFFRSYIPLEARRAEYGFLESDPLYLREVKIRPIT